MSDNSLDYVSELEQVFLDDDGCQQLIKTLSFVLPAGIDKASFNFEVCGMVVDYVLRFERNNAAKSVKVEYSSEDIDWIEGIENQQRGVITMTNVPAGVFCSKKKDMIYTLPDNSGFVDITYFINSYSFGGDNGEEVRFVNLSLWHRQG